MKFWRSVALASLATVAFPLVITLAALLVALQALRGAEEKDDAVDR